MRWPIVDVNRVIRRRDHHGEPTVPLGSVAQTEASHGVVDLNPGCPAPGSHTMGHRHEQVRGRHGWLRWAAVGITVVIVAVELALAWDQLARAWHSVYTAAWWWVLAATLAALASMHSFAQIQRTLLRSAGVTVNRWRSEAAFFAGNALSSTLPGGPVVSTTFLYRQQRRWGASPVVASWQLGMAGALQIVGLALLGALGALVLGAKNNPFSLIFTLGGLLALIIMAQAVASHPDSIDGLGVRVLSWVNTLRARPAETGLGAWRATLTQIKAVKLGRQDLAIAFGWSLLNWLADMACLLFAAWAAGGAPSLAGLAIAYSAARAVGSIPLMPGGLLIVEAVLVPGLVSAGLPLHHAISAMLIYRLISWVFIAAIGWVLFAFLFRTDSHAGEHGSGEAGLTPDTCPR